ncbi:MAG: iron-only hydrogenase system regulator [Oscillospiraceae bacterium]|nr:iron-only hydrogenase system regulator [Oscillospiraceae bacterium]
MTETQETRVVLLGIVVDEPDSVEALNQLLHQYSRYIIGRMGLPYRERQVSIISVVLDAPGDAVSALSGKIGRLKGVTAKAVYSKLPGDK